MKRSFGRSASPIAAMVVLAALLQALARPGRKRPAQPRRRNASGRGHAGGERRRGVSDCRDQREPDGGAAAWTKASLDEDWPAPVRTEPAGPATIVPVSLEGEDYPDPTGDTESGAFRGSTSTGWDSVTTTPWWPTSRGRRKWIRQNSGSLMGSSSTTTATASRTGGSGWTTSRARGGSATSGVDHRPPHRSNGVVGPELA